MKLNKRIIAFKELGKILKDIRNNSTRSGLNLAIENASKANNWFSKENIFHSIEALGETLDEEKINQRISGYSHIDKENKHGKTIYNTYNISIGRSDGELLLSSNQQTNILYAAYNDYFGGPTVAVIDSYANRIMKNIIIDRFN